MTNEEIDELVALHVRKFGFDEYKAYGKCFKPSTDVGIAFECVDKWLECGRTTFDLEVWKDGEGGEVFVDCFVGSMNGRYGVQDNSTSLAICKALLKAVGIEIN